MELVGLQVQVLQHRHSAQQSHSTAKRSESRSIIHAVRSQWALSKGAKAPTDRAVVDETLKPRTKNQSTLSIQTTHKPSTMPPSLRSTVIEILAQVSWSGYANSEYKCLSAVPILDR